MSYSDRDFADGVLVREYAMAKMTFTLKLTKKFGGVRGKMYLCIRLAAFQQLK